MLLHMRLQHIVVVADAPVLLQVKLQHLVTLHIKSSAFGSKLDAGMFMKALSLQYDVWAENQYQHLLTVRHHTAMSMPVSV